MAIYRRRPMTPPNKYVERVTTRMITPPAKCIFAFPGRTLRTWPGEDGLTDGAPASQRPQIPPFIFGQSANKTGQQTASFRGALAKIGKDHFFCVFWAVLKRLSRDDIFFRLLSGIACRWRLFQAASWEQKLYGKPIRGNVGINDRDMNPRSSQCRWMW